MQPLPARLEFVVEPGDPLQRLDTLVVALLERAQHSVSRSTIRHWIDNGRIRVDDHPARAGARVRMGARIIVEPEPPPPSDALPDASIAVVVLYQDDHLLIVDKPAGLVVHPARGHMTGTLVHGLLAHSTFDAELLTATEPDASGRPGIVHRLDKDTSGVMVVARTIRAREGLKELFARHDIEREYEAVVVGTAQPATFDTLLGRHPTDRLRFSTHATSGKRAITRVRVVERLAGGRATRVVCELETGRTHQIRVHLAECSKTPVLGDALYGGRIRDAAMLAESKALGRHWLHARVLGFAHPVTRQTLHFEAALPPELAACLARLRAMGAEPTAG